MKQSRIRPREDQIAELTRSQILPLAPLSERHLMFISAILVRAWNELLVDRFSILATAEEAEVNTLVETRLNALLEEDERWSQLVSAVARGRETISYDGSHLEKRPDLSIYLTNRSRSFPLIVECKLVDAPSGKKVDLYCNEGLARFVRGEYGWATREAFMVGYVRDGSTISSCLVPFLADSRTKQPDAYLTQSLPNPAAAPNMQLARSSHGREFCYIGRNSELPGEIAIWHLWIAARTK
jgi:hypothetical protein